MTEIKEKRIIKEVKLIMKEIELKLKNMEFVLKQAQANFVIGKEQFDTKIQMMKSQDNADQMIEIANKARDRLLKSTNDKITSLKKTHGCFKILIKTEKLSNEMGKFLTLKEVLNSKLSTVDEVISKFNALANADNTSIYEKEQQFISELRDGLKVIIELNQELVKFDNKCAETIRPFNKNGIITYILLKKNIIEEIVSLIAVKFDKIIDNLLQEIVVINSNIKTTNEDVLVSNNEQNVAQKIFDILGNSTQLNDLF